MSPSPLRVLRAMALLFTVFGVVRVGGLAIAFGPIVYGWITGDGSGWLNVAGLVVGLTIAIQLAQQANLGHRTVDPELRAEDAPRLHALLREAAQAAGDEPADVVRVTLDSGMDLRRRRGRRVLALSLPLLVAVEEDELRALAVRQHAIAAGPRAFARRWVRVNRGRTGKRIIVMRGFGRVRRALVLRPFTAFTRTFLRITNPIAADEAFAADAAAVATTSVEATSRAIRRQDAVQTAWPRSLVEDAIASLAEGRIPAIVADFRAALRRSHDADELISPLDAVPDDDLGTLAGIPSLRERLAAIGATADGRAMTPARTPAIDLVGDVDELEARTVAANFEPELDVIRKAGV